MYKSFYKLKKKPFQLGSDESFVWHSEEQKDALETLRLGIVENEGFFLVTGDVGTGKTTFIAALIKALNNQVIHASVPDPRLDRLDLFNYIAGAFGIDEEFTSKGKFIAAFSAFLNETSKQKKRVLLVIDESQLLDQKSLEEIRLLSNIPVEDNCILNILFVGHIDFNEILEKEENKALKQRISFTYTLDPLNPEQTTHYINHHMMVAGATDEIFKSSALSEIHSASGGFPRRINIICDHCLKTAYKAGKKIISKRDVVSCIADLSIPVYSDADNYLKREDKYTSEDYIPSNVLFDSYETIEQGSEFIDADELQHFDPDESDLLPEEEDKGYLKKVAFGSIFILLLAAVVFFFRDALLSNYYALTEQQSQSEKEVASLSSDAPEQSQSLASNASDPVSNEAEESSPESITPEAEESSPESITPEAAEDVKNIDNLETSQELTSSLEVTAVEESADPTPPEVEIQDDAPIESPASKEENSIAMILEQQSPPTIAYDEGIVNDEAPVLPLENNRETQSTNITINSRKDEPFRTVEKDNIDAPETLLVIQFETDSTQLRGVDDVLVAEYIDFLKKYPDSIAIIAGHSDSWGAADYNRLISKYRAEIVKGYLMGKGVPKSQIRVFAYGQNQPAGDNSTSAGRKLNRRVEVSLVFSDTAN